MLGLIFFVGVRGNFAILIMISQLILEIGVCGDIILGIIIGDIRDGCVGVRGASNVSLSSIFFPLFFCFFVLVAEQGANF